MTVGTITTRTLCVFISTLLIILVNAQNSGTKYCIIILNNGTHKEYRCGNATYENNKKITIVVPQGPKSGIVIRCNSDYKQHDYAEWISGFDNDRSAEAVEFTIEQCLVPDAPFIKIFNIFDAKNIRRFSYTNFDSSKEHYLQPYHFKNLSNIRELTIRGYKFESLDENVFNDMYNLEILFLKTNKWNNLPTNIFKPLKKLKNLHLSINWTNYLNETIFRFTPKLQNLSLINNKLDNLSNSIFEPLRELKTLDLGYNKMKILNDGLFDYLGNLEKLELNENELTSLPEKIFRYNSKLKEINLNSNKLATLPKTLFHNTTELEILHLEDNELVQLDETLFRGLTNLEILNLSENHLKTISRETFKELRSLQKLYLNNNQLEMNASLPSPLFGCCPNLNELNLSHNKLTKVFEDWRDSFHNLRILSFEYNYLENLTIQELTFTNRDKMTFYYNHNKIKTIDLTDFATWAFEDSRPITEIHIVGNPLECDCNALDLFKYFKNDTMKNSSVRIQNENLVCKVPAKFNKIKLLDSITNPLDLKCPLYEGCPQNCKCMNRSFDQTIEIDCTSSGINDFPKSFPTLKGYKLALFFNNNTFTSIEGLNRLTKEIRGSITQLMLSGNKLTQIDSILSLEALTTLDLSGNKLSYLNQTMIGKLENAANLTIVELHGNPWECDCETKYLLKFVRNQYKRIPNYKNITCREDQRSVFDLTEEDLCHTSLRIILTVAILGVLGLIFGVVMALYYKHEHEIKVWMFAHKIFLGLITEKEIDKDKLYDAFVSFSHKDQYFVDQYLIPELEEKGDHTFNLCIHYRDFVVGEFIPSQIVYSVENSRRTIIVMTSNFLQSIWARMEFRTAHLQAIKERHARVIVILLEEINCEELDPELKAYIKLNTYVKWGDSSFWEKLRYALPHPQITSRKNRRPRTAVLSETELRKIQNA